MINKVTELVSPLIPKVVGYRRYLHQHPELSFQEQQTAQWICDRLTEMGIATVERVAGTGVVARIKGAKPGPTLAFRADMDALPVGDEKNVCYRSQNTGVMHGCGHDGHVAMLLGLAEFLQTNKQLVKGEVVLLFQHAEERVPGGAVELIAEGCLEGVEALFGVHLWTPFKVGTVGIKTGPVMAATDRFKVEINGKGGHGASPHETIDAVVIAAKAITDLQLLVSRYVDPVEPAVVTVGKISGGSTFNVIAEQVTFEGTVRSFNEDTRTLLEQKMEQMIKGVCQSTGASYRFDYLRGHPPLYNHSKETDIVREAVQKLDKYQVFEMKPVMGGEDFAYYMEQVSGCYFFIGAGNVAKGITYPHHHPLFDIDEQALTTGLESLVSTYLHCLQNGSLDRKGEI